MQKKERRLTVPAASRQQPPRRDYLMRFYAPDLAGESNAWKRGTVLQQSLSLIRMGEGKGEVHADRTPKMGEKEKEGCLVFDILFPHRRMTGCLFSFLFPPLPPF